MLQSLKFLIDFLKKEILSTTSNKIHNFKMRFNHSTLIAISTIPITTSYSLHTTKLHICERDPLSDLLYVYKPVVALFCWGSVDVQRPLSTLLTLTTYCKIEIIVKFWLNSLFNFSNIFSKASVEEFYSTVILSILFFKSANDRLIWQFPAVKCFNSW